MGRINVYEPVDPDDFESGPMLAGWFASEKAERWSDMDHNGNGSGGAGRGQAVWRTAGGRWVLESWSRREDEEDHYRFIADDEAREWLLCNTFDNAVDAYFGEIEEERGPGRPEIGVAKKIRLGDLADPATDLAEKQNISLAELVRRAVRQYLTTETAIETQPASP